MPKATLQFDLPEEDGDFNAAVQGRRAITILWEIDQWCRGLLKHGDPTKEQTELAEEIRQMIPFDLLEM
jgi:hypothetical protein